MTRDQVDALERALREAEPPDAGPARERARRTVLAAHDATRTRRRARRAVPLVCTALAAILAALFVTQRDSGPAQAVERLVREIVREPKATPVPVPKSEFALPAAGRLLVSGADGLFVVSRNGHRTALGDYEDADWSPRGWFVAATNARTLTALNPANGHVRWKVQPGGPVSLPRWAPDGLHIAYRAGHTLRIVYGNGEHDVIAGRDMAAVAPAWRPNTPRTVAWAAGDGTVTVEDADTAKVLWTFRSGAVRHLAWSDDGRTLLIAGRRHGTVRDLVAGTSTPLRLDGDLLAVAAARGRFAFAVRRGTRTEIRLRGTVLVSAAGRLDDLAWSPDGRWLLAGDATTGEWLLARATGRASVSSLSVAPRFGSGARTRGWCC
ncbi:WD40 repeat domain-containing protein [Solirubrobacter ginsenosidimutans]|uniref:WD40 repeat domain-containing protein n=1 Tax=Solirubrobacter ginsenosidimutans TaxID=490573 RepID=A0A9X3MVC7_9ACTN|nr:WD40 repeat domain-containing protein [Solirubrobacter ginsenosidimutans]MDA0161962.1 WD40 repeat domain-containing protein [Solirubrobacter ginsenosidimutans]